VVTLQDAFLFDYSAGMDQQGRFLGKPIATGVRPRFLDRFEELGIHVSPNVFATPSGRWDGDSSGQPCRLPQCRRHVLRCASPGVPCRPETQPQCNSTRPASAVHLPRAFGVQRVTESTVTAVDGVIGEKGGLYSKETLYNAGIKASPAEVTVFILAASVPAVSS
jgi:hypothetical protein